MYLKFNQTSLTVGIGLILLLSSTSCVGETTDSMPSATISSQSSTSEPPPSTEIVATASPRVEPTSTSTAVPTATEPVSTPLPFPAEIFTSDILWEDVTPVEYVDDRCEHLRNRWDPEKSPPGTIVAPIMFHSVRKSGRPISDATSISEEYFHAVLSHASELGFETITTEELIAFLTTNAKIPPRSMIMILDDRRPGVTERFLPYLESNDWTLTLGWIIEDQREYLWEWMETLAESGRLDVQSHGYWHRYIVDETSEEIIDEEINGPIPILVEHFGYRPIAFIWPGGNFTARSIQVAHEAGYQVAFGAYAHGPLMYNWVPQTKEEIDLGDPLMTLPRFWSTVAWRNLDETVELAESARLYAADQYSIEADWYQASCGGELPPSPF